MASDICRRWLNTRRVRNKMGVKYREHLPVGMVVAIIIFVAAMLFIAFGVVYESGAETGYKECLEDARLGKQPKYELVEVAKKWVRR